MVWFLHAFLLWPLCLAAIIWPPIVYQIISRNEIYSFDNFSTRASFVEDVQKHFYLDPSAIIVVLSAVI